MPRSLSYIKTLASKGIDYRGLHVIDVMSLCTSIDIDAINKELIRRNKERMNKAGITDIVSATQDDFDAL